MKVIICGAGRVGGSIARQLVQENNDITIVDSETEALGKIGNSLDVKTVHGFACYPTVLDEAGAHDADMIIAVTASDEVNMIACQMAKSIFKVPTKIARLRHQSYLMPQYMDIYRAEEMPIDVIISPEIEVAKNILNRFHVPGASESIPIENSSVKIIGVRIMRNSPVIGLDCTAFAQKFSHVKTGMLGVYRDNDFLIQNRKLVLQENDEIFMVLSNKSIPKTMEILGHEEEEAHKIVIIGGGNIGLYIAKELEAEDSGNRIKIIELSTARAEYIASKLNNTMVLNGSALDEAILEEVNISEAETVIAVTNDDEVNILSSLLAKNMGAKLCFTLLNNHSFVPLMANLGIDVTVNPRESTVSSILQHVRRGKIRSAHSLKDDKAEVLEAEISESIGLVGKKLGDIEFPAKALVGAIIREGKFVAANPLETLQRRDRLIIMALPKDVKDVEDLFCAQSRFF
jgi:trk system potassium uptake protein TrkA